MILAGTLVAAVAALLMLDQPGGASADAASAPYHYPLPVNGLPLVTPPPPPGVINNGLASIANVGPGLAAASQSLDQRPYLGAHYQDSEVQRHVYVHVAPDEPPEQHVPVVVNVRKPKKHYKIVFIKAPTVPPPAAAHVNVPPPDQEKTLIYVLSKRPDLQPQVVVSTPAPTQPPKPEVYFIRYNTVTGQSGQQGQPHGVPAGSVAGVLPPANSYGTPLGAPLGSLQHANAPAEPSHAVNSNAL